MRTPTKEDIVNAHERILPFIHRTPVLSSEAITDMVGAEVFFKCENFQKIGAFKMRGAANAVFSTPEADRTNGFAAHSSGNHGQAVAKAAKLAGVPSYIVMPKNSNPIKVEAVKGYGAEVTLCEPNDQARTGTTEEIINRTGAKLIHPFEDPRIVEGQATTAKELIEDLPDLDHILCPIGGGGLCAGTALSSKYFGDKTSVIGTEPENLNDAFLSLQSGVITRGNPTASMADGLRTLVGSFTFGIIKEHIDEIQTVSESEMVNAMRLVWERMKILIEPSSAVPIAAVLKNKEMFAGKKVGIIVTGGNVDLTNLPF